MATTHLVDFSDPSSIQGWQGRGDAVMGGISAGRLLPVDGAACFTGEVRPENDGGFASVLSPIAVYDLSDAAGIALRVRGDGKTYTLTLRCETRPGLRYQADFQPEAGTWETVHLLWTAFTTKQRGRVLRGGPTLDTQRINRFGLMITGRQYGPFALEIAYIATYASA